MGFTDIYRPYDTDQFLMKGLTYITDELKVKATT